MFCGGSVSRCFRVSELDGSSNNRKGGLWVFLYSIVETRHVDTNPNRFG